MMGIRPSTYRRSSGDVSYPIYGLCVVLACAVIVYGSALAWLLS